MNKSCIAFILTCKIHKGIHKQSTRQPKYLPLESRCTNQFQFSFGKMRATGFCCAHFCCCCCWVFWFNRFSCLGHNRHINRKTKSEQNLNIKFIRVRISFCVCGAFWIFNFVFILFDYHIVWSIISYSMAFYTFILYENNYSSKFKQ